MSGTEEGTCKWWLAQLEERQTALKKSWLDEAKKITEIFDAGPDDEKIPFNILYSNTETLLPTLFNSLPRPDVSRRYTQADPERRKMDSAVQQATERQLEYFVDSNQGEYDDFDEAIVAATTAALVPGLGQVRVHLVQEGSHQKICPQIVQYDRFVWGYSRTWSMVPWVAFGHDLTKEDFARQFPEAAKKDEYKTFDWKKLSDPEGETAEEQRKGRQDTLLVWEIEHAHTKQKKFVCEHFPDDFLLEEAYPANLTSRFSCPRPLIFKRKLGEQLPIPLYKLYKKQAEELQLITKRINGIVRAMKIRGIYNQVLGDLEAALNASGDVVLVASKEAMAVSQEGLDKQVWMMPVDKLIQVLTQLRVDQQACKNVIFEIMGIADILRGSSVASETAKAQEIKNQWGTLRVKRSQRIVSIFCRDLMRIAAEMAADTFTPATWRSVTQLPYLFEMEKQGIQAKMQQDAAMAQQQMMAAQMAGMPPQPPPPPNPQMQYLLGLPTWEAVMGVLKDSLQRSFRIDVETNSTVDLEATEDKVAIGEFMNAFGQMTSGLTPLVEAGVLPFDAAKAILSETFRKFRFGRRVQDALDAMTPPQPKPDAQAVQQQHKAEIATKDATHAAEKEKWTQIETQLKAQLAQEKVAKTGIELQGKQREGELKADSQGKMRLQEQNLAGKEQALQEKELDMNIQQAQQAIAQTVQQAQQAIQQMVQQAVQEIKQITTEASHERELSAKETEAKEGAESGALAQVAEGQKAIMEAIAQMTKAVSAPRQRTMTVDEKTGQKSVIDKVLQ